MLRSAGAWLALLGALFATGCASIPPPPVADLPPAAAKFDASGRLSVKGPRDSIVARFEWSHSIAEDAIELATPLGTTLARLTRADGRAELELSGGRVERADSFETLAERALGAPVPIAGLAWWVQGAPRPGSEHVIERDSAGRARVLRQEGWEIVLDYAEPAATLPTRLVLTYPDIEVRLVIDRWR